MQVRRTSSVALALDGKPRSFACECPVDRSVLKFKLSPKSTNVRVRLKCPGCEARLTVRIKAVYQDENDETPIRYDAIVEKSQRAGSE